MQKISIAIVVTLASSLVQAAELSGVSRAIDGDTLYIGATKIRLEGIDAPETDQVCLDAKGARWTCGIGARDQLASRVAGRVVSCLPSSTDRFRRTLATCSLGAENLNRWMVEQGWALAYVKYSSAYVRAQQVAQDNQRGLWQGAFIAPWNWRHRNRRTEILGAVKVPRDAQELLLPPRAWKTRRHPSVLSRET
jgi:endonuclease YncB( thermonuclease family)